MARHGVIKTNYLYGSPYEYLNNFAELRATRAINFAAFADSMLKFAGARYLSPKSVPGDGDMIYYRYDTAAHLSFIGGWGDCPSGCMAWKQWTYSIFPGSCSVGADTILVDNVFRIPKSSFANCNGWPLQLPKTVVPAAPILTLFPNPAGNMLQLKGLAGKPVTYQITDLAGRILLRGTCTNNQIEVAPLPAGLYLLNLREAGGATHNLKFIKK